MFSILKNKATDPQVPNLIICYRRFEHFSYTFSNVFPSILINISRQILL
jgi:hypothetical protein